MVYEFGPYFAFIKVRLNTCKRKNKKDKSKLGHSGRLHFEESLRNHRNTRRTLKSTLQVLLNDGRESIFESLPYFPKKWVDSRYRFGIKVLIDVS
jgi:hypothetical protein